MRRALDLPESLPLADSQTGNLFSDRTDNNLRWYLPAFALAPDPDPLFQFTARQEGVDSSTGNPFNTAKLTLSLKKMMPADVAQFQSGNSGVKLREIPLTSTRVSLRTISKNPANGQEQRMNYAGAISSAPNGDLNVTFDANILGPAVIVLYENLLQGGALIDVSASYEVWQRIGNTIPASLLRASAIATPRVASPMVRVSPVGAARVAGGDVAPVPRPAPAALAAVGIRPIARMPADNFAVARVARVPIEARATVLERPNIAFRPADIPPLRPTPVPVPPAPTPTPPDPFQRGSSSMSIELPLGIKYAAGAYGLRYLLATNSATRPIIDVEDLRNFNLKQSEFKELGVFGDISQKFPSISRLYLGVLSKTIVVIPTHYAITRTVNGLGTLCQALLDPADGNQTRCKFVFTFILGPDVSALDMYNLSQEVRKRPELQDYTLTLPDFLKEGSVPNLVNDLADSVQSAAALDRNTFALSVGIKDRSDSSPAIARANLFLDGLCEANQPFLFGSFSLKLDDYYDKPVDASFVVNFRETAGKDDFIFSVNQDARTVTLLNHLPFDLQIKRLALLTDKGLAAPAVGATVKSGATLLVPLPQEHDGLCPLIDSEIAADGAISRSEIEKFIKFQSQDVQTTQCMFGVNASGVNFEARGISQIDVQVSVRNLPSLQVPQFSLVPLHRVDRAIALVPFVNAISTLQADILFIVHHSDPAQADQKLSLSHEFMRTPIFILNDSDLGAAP
jgi:hypothetical protein